MLTNSSVVSWCTFPACDKIVAFPPGCQARTLVTSYTLPSTTIQQSYSLLCFSISCRVNSFCGVPASWAASAILFCMLGIIHPPSAVPGSTGCRNRIAGPPPLEAPSSQTTSIRTVYQQLFIMPMTFQFGSRGCVFLNTSKQRTAILSARTRCTSSMSTYQCNQDQNLLPWRIARSGNCRTQHSHVRPPSSDASTRCTLCPPPAYAYPATRYVRPLRIPASETRSPCAGRAMTELSICSLHAVSGWRNSASAKGAFLSSTTI